MSKLKNPLERAWFQHAETGKIKQLPAALLKDKKWQVNNKTYPIDAPVTDDPEAIALMEKQFQKPEVKKQPPMQSKFKETLKDFPLEITGDDHSPVTQSPPERKLGRKPGNK